MRKVLLMLWWTSVCIQQDNFLECYSCIQVNTTEACKPALCLGQANMCFSHQVFVNLGRKYYTEITRGCTQQCRMPSEWDRFSAEQIVFANNLCCSTSLCNRGCCGQAARWGLPLCLGLSLHHAQL